MELKGAVAQPRTVAYLVYRGNFTETKVGGEGVQ